jgi:hypothetical protein
MGLESRIKVVALIIAPILLFFLFRDGGSGERAGVDQVTVAPRQLSSSSSADRVGDLRPENDLNLSELGFEGGDENVAAAIDAVDPALFQALRVNPHCRGCEQAFETVRARFKTATDVGAVTVLAQALAQSERAELVAELLARYSSPDLPAEVRTEIALALEQVSGGEEVSRVLAPIAAGEPGAESARNPDGDDELREAVVTGLTGMSDTVAAEALLRYARSVGDGKGGYDGASGLGEFVPNEDAGPLLQRVVVDRSNESPLAVRALLNGGPETTRVLFEAIASIDDEAEQARLLSGAQSHVLIEPDTLNYLRELSRSPSARLTPTVRSFLEDVLARDGGTG